MYYTFLFRMNKVFVMWNFSILKDETMLQAVPYAENSNIRDSISWDEFTITELFSFLPLCHYIQLPSFKIDGVSKLESRYQNRHLSTLRYCL